MKCRIRKARRILARVAPHWGAWIEIRMSYVANIMVFGRTPLGCVD